MAQVESAPAWTRRTSDGPRCRPLLKRSVRAPGRVKQAVNSGRAEINGQDDREQRAHQHRDAGQAQAGLLVEQVAAVSPTVVHSTLITQK